CLVMPPRPILAAGRVLLRHQSDPSCHMPARCKGMRVGNCADQRSSDDRTDTRNPLQPAAELARTVPGLDAVVELADLTLNSLILLGESHEADPGNLGDPKFLRSVHYIEQPFEAEASARSNDAEFGQLATDSVAQHRTLAHQQLAGPVQHQSSLLL